MIDRNEQKTIRDVEQEKSQHHNARGTRYNREKLVIKRDICPSCGHHKMFYYPSMNSIIRRKCTRCRYTEYE